MDWGSLIGAALLISLAILALRALWCWLIVLAAFGPPTVAGLWAGYEAGVTFGNFPAGLFTAVLVTGILTECLRCALRRLC